jgi:uncharacterized linocin/CFP29 family protein
MTTDNPQVPWTDEQWGRVNQVIQEEASRARVAATFLPLIGPLPADTDFVRREQISYRLETAQPLSERITINDRAVLQLATLQVRVPLRGAQMADPEMTSALALFRRAANVVARLEDVVVFRGLIRDPTTPPNDPPRFIPPPAALVGIPRIWEITGGEALSGLWTITNPVQWIRIALNPIWQGEELVVAISTAIGSLESAGHFGPFAVVLDQNLFRIAQDPDPNSLVLPQDRIIPFLGGGSLVRSSTLDQRFIGTGVVVALGGSPIELVVATDMCLQFLQLTSAPEFLFRVCEKMVIRIKEPEAIRQLYL